MAEGNPFRNLRPEMAPTNIAHRAFKLLPEAYDRVRVALLAVNGLHRLAFIAAAMEFDGIFIDVRQESVEEPVPYPDGGSVAFCAIVGDRTIERTPVKGIPGGAELSARSLGPDAYHQQSLKALFARADMVTIDVTGRGNAVFYAGACAATAMHGKNTILIETTVDLAMQWANFVNNNTTNCKKIIVDDTTTPEDISEATVSSLN